MREAVFTVLLFFFFQAEDGIRDLTVTGVQTCALPICEVALMGTRGVHVLRAGPGGPLSDTAVVSTVAIFHESPAPLALPRWDLTPDQIGRASCRERV